MKKSLNWIIAIVVIVIIIMLVSRSNHSSSNTFTIGISTGITGSAAFAGENCRDGFVAAEKKINETGGIDGKKVALIIEDNKNDAKEGLSAYRKLMTAKPDFFIQSFTVPTLAVNSEVIKDGIPMFVTVSFSNITAKNDNAISMYPTADDEARATTGDMKANGITKVAVIYVNTEYGQSNLASFKKFAAEKGITIVAEEAFLSTVTDYTTPITKINALKPQAVYLIALGSTPIVKQLKNLKTTAAIYSNNLPIFGNQVNDDSATWEGIHMTGYRSAIKGTPEYDRVRNALTGFSEKNTLGYTATCYDNLLAVAAVLNKDPNVSNFVKNFSTFGVFEGANGTYTLNSRDVGATLYPITMKNGVLTEVK